MFWFFGHKACGILAPQPEIEPTPSALEGEVFNHWTAREVPIFYFYTRVKSDLSTTITVLECSEFDCILTFTMFHTFIFFSCCQHTFVITQRPPFSISCKTGLVVKNSTTFLFVCLFVLVLESPYLSFISEGQLVRFLSIHG